MSNPADSADAGTGLMLSVAEQLIPLFATAAAGIPQARRIALSAVEAYAPETRADYINTARIIAFSMAALALLGRAAADEIAIAEKLRIYGRANALNRSAEQSERSMMQRRRLGLAMPRAGLAVETVPREDTPAPGAASDDETEIEAAVAEAMKEYLSICRPAHAGAAASEITSASTPVTPAGGPLPRPSRPIQPPAAMPAGPIHYDIARSAAGQPRTPSYREELLRHSALQRAVEQSGAAPPG